MQQELFKCSNLPKIFFMKYSQIHVLEEITIDGFMKQSALSLALLSLPFAEIT